MKNGRFVGLDVHAETIAVAVAEPDGEVRALGVIPNRPESIRKLVKKLAPAAKLRACYEPGPTGYVVYWHLVALGVPCEVVGPTLVPVRAGDRVKTDRRLRGIARVSAMTIVAEVGTLSRFATASQLMGYSGAVPSEVSSGEWTRRGHITKTGNAHLRRVIIEAAWAYRYRPALGVALRTRQAPVAPE